MQQTKQAGQQCNISSIPLLTGVACALRGARQCVARVRRLFASCQGAELGRQVVGNGATGSLMKRKGVGSTA
jgi:hypothetical protein